jgi:predicted branched-subunit amino acid permease
MRDITLQVVAGSLWRGGASLSSVTDPYLVSTLLVGLRHSVYSLVWNGKVKSLPRANCHLIHVCSLVGYRSPRRNTKFLKHCW